MTQAWLMRNKLKFTLALAALGLGGLWMVNAMESTGLKAGGMTASQIFGDAKVVALAHAIEHEDLQAITQAVEHGADIRAQGIHGESLLHWASLKPNVQAATIEHLLKLGADPNAALTKINYSALQIAAGGTRPDILELMLKYGGNPNVQATNGRTPLQEAISSQFEVNVKILFKYGADPNLGHACLSTVSSARFDFTALLLQHGLTKDLPLCRRYIEGRNVGKEYLETLEQRVKVLQMLEERGVGPGGSDTPR